MPAKKEAVQILVDRAIETLRNQPAPDGLSDDESKSRFHSIFDSPAQWIARAKGLEMKQRPEPSALGAKGTKRFK